jgi:tRNA isopentenyl-2-thiomethyl-A-37 hydroxylase MiaE
MECAPSRSDTLTSRLRHYKDFLDLADQANGFPKTDQILRELGLLVTRCGDDEVLRLRAERAILCLNAILV